MHKKEQEVYFVLRGKHSQDSILRLKNVFSGMSIKKLFGPHVSRRPDRVTANQHIFKSRPSYSFFSHSLEYQV